MRRDQPFLTAVKSKLGTEQSRPVKKHPVAGSNTGILSKCQGILKEKKDSITEKRN